MSSFFAKNNLHWFNFNPVAPVPAVVIKRKYGQALLVSRSKLIKCDHIISPDLAMASDKAKLSENKTEKLPKVNKIKHQIHF